MNFFRIAEGRIAEIRNLRDDLGLREQVGAPIYAERRLEVGKLIATTQAIVDGVIDPVGEWVQADGDHGDYLPGS